ncbi:hypothetical protein MTR_2g088090 [Medicago truncatula]|uniref:Uncharacterized protein n=1 Tax=Medicago truncatula TaxID=3880 RepID=G7ITW7_MEDTR|nr:hypothetical protein MTR_2g088090 [Medicago truncatula]
MDVRKYGFENLCRTQSIDWRIMVLEEGFWGVTKKEGIDLTTFKVAASLDLDKTILYCKKKKKKKNKTILTLQLVATSLFSP